MRIWSLRRVVARVGIALGLVLAAGALLLAVGAPTRAQERLSILTGVTRADHGASDAVRSGAAPAPDAPSSLPPERSSSPLGETYHEILVYFSRHPESDDDFSAVFPVARRAPDAGVATSALEALIAGPSPAEADAGYFSEIGQMLHGESNCRDEDFALRLEDGLATIRFCREVNSAGIGQDARVQSTLEATLRQFPTIQRVRILDRDGNCLFDMSGENRCLTAP